MSDNYCNGPAPTILLGVTVDQSLRFIEALAYDLTEQGWRVHVVSSPGERLSRMLATVNTHGLKMARDPNPLADAVALVKWVAMLLRLRPSRVMVGTPKASLLAMVASYLCRTPARIYVMHGLRLDAERGWKRSLLLQLERLTISLATHVLVVSGSLRSHALALNLGPSEKLHVIASGSATGIDTQRFSPAAIPPDQASALRDNLGIPTGSPVALFVGRLHPDKGIGDLLDAIDRVRDRIPTVRLLLVGPIESELIGARIAQQSDNHVIHVGAVDDPRPYLASADILCLPSHREGFGIAVLEAAAMEVPAVGTDIPGLRDAVASNQTGILVPVSDPDGLADAIAILLQNSQLRCEMGYAARLRVERHFKSTDVSAWYRTFLEAV